jgi:uncharacterized membrane protein YfcA
MLLEIIAPALAGGAVVGLALGLTGGGGTLLAVPVLIHGLGLPARQAAIASLAAVGAMALMGAATRIRRGEAYLGLGLFFALGGIVGAPLGVMSHRWLPDPLIATGFAVLMIAVALRMWPDHVRPLTRTSAALPPELQLGRCSLSADGRLRLNSRCVPVLLGLGLATGVLSGIFGVGGGFLIVPALVWLSRCDLRHAVATSLVAVAVISAAGVAGAVIGGEPFPLAITAWFALGGIGGLLISGRVGQRLPPAVLGRGFSLVLIALAVFVILRR